MNASTVKSKAISPAALAALRGIEWIATGRAVLPVRLERKVYQECNDVLVSLGGRWSRSDKAHVFDTDQELALEALINVGTFVKPQDYRAAFGFFETPPDLARRLVELAEIEPGMSVLEPSAGTGRLVRAIREACPVIMLEAVEIQPNLYEGLQRVVTPFVVFGEDFLAFARNRAAAYPNGSCDRVVMNPPFARQADIDHVLAAWHLLKPGGRLVAIMSAGVEFRTNEKTEHFREIVRDHGRIERLSEGSFASEGTSVNTVLVVLNREAV